MYKLCVYVPESHLEQVKQALFASGAGRLGKYDQCCWQSAGEGQFRSLAGSKPHSGEIGQVERVSEYKLELIIDDEYLAAALSALKSAHPYEEPAYQYYPVNFTHDAS